MRRMVTRKEGSKGALSAGRDPNIQRGSYDRAGQGTGMLGKIETEW